MKKYTIDQLNTFLNLLREHEIIFNYSRPDHKDKIKLNAAFEVLTAELLQEGESYFDISRKFVVGRASCAFYL